MRFVDDSLIDDIESAKERIDKKRLELFVNKLFVDMEKQANEFAATSDEDNILNAKDVVKSYQQAWDHAIDHQDGKFNRILLTEVAALIEPCQMLHSLRPYADFRETESYGWKDVSYCPPAGKDRVIEHISRMERVLNNKCIHPIEEAFFTFLHISRIQPFEYGNKRTANIMMNSLLKYNNFAPIIFKDQQTYRRLLVEAAKGFRNDGSQTSEGLYPYLNPGKEQLAFYEHLANIELKELQTVEHILKGLHQYRVELKAKGQCCNYAVKAKVDSWFRTKDRRHVIQLSAKTGIMNIVGDIPVETLDQIIRASAGIKKYKIKSNGHY
jgi:fido (protein-threonine AMPylation protein)